MTLAELKSKADAVKIGGRVLPADLETYQQMVFDYITQLCDPLNLVIPYRDSDIYRVVEIDGRVEWFLRKPRIAVDDADYIDIDERLEMAFVYSLAAFVAADSDRLVLERRAERVCVEYACEVLDMGLPKAKEVYGQESYIHSVRFDCMGRVYHVDESFVKMVIECILCGKVCMNASQKKQLDLYKRYLAGDSMRPMDVDHLRALDMAIFRYVLEDLSLLERYSNEELSSVTTLFCAFDKITAGESVEPWVNEVNIRLGGLDA